MTTTAPADSITGTLDFAAQNSWTAVLWSGLLILNFIAIAVLADDYLVPAAVKICAKLRIPDHAAGASVLGLATSAPEIVIGFVSALRGYPEFGLATIFGSALIQLGLIPAILVLFSEDRTLQLSPLPFVRDAAFLTVSFVLLLVFLSSGRQADDPLSPYHLEQWETVLLSCLLVVYLLAVLVPVCVNCRNASDGNDVEVQNNAVLLDNADAEAPVDTEPTDLPAEEGGAATTESESGTSTDNDAVVPTGSYGVFTKCWNYFLFPLRWVFSWIMPPVTDQQIAEKKKICTSPLFAHLYPITCIIAFLIMTGLGTSTVLLCQALHSSLCACKTTGSALGGTETITFEFIGAILVAIGIQVPDIFSSVSLARNGFAESALASCIGSQVVTILMGVAIPFMLYSLTHKQEPLDLPPTAGDQAVLFSTLSMALVFVIVAFASKTFMSIKHKTCQEIPMLVNVWGAVVLLITYLVATIVIVAFSLITFSS